MVETAQFQNLFEIFGRLPSSHAEAVNRGAYEELHAILSVPVDHTGRFILLKAPRAGHGKTHLLARTQHYLSGGHVFVALHAAGGARIDAGTVVDDILRALLKPLPAAGGVCELDLLARKLFSLALQPLVVSGEVPCQDRDGALSALRHRPVETFDFHHPSAVTAQWAKEHYGILGPRLAIELAQHGNLPIREVTFWVDALFQFSSTAPGDPERLKNLSDTVHAGAPADGELMERLQALVGLLSLLVRVVLVADELEGFSADPSAALRFTAFAGALRQSAERVEVLVSLNDDIWKTAFVPKLSDGLLDRLSEVVVELKPLGESEVVALIESRAPGKGTEIAATLDKSSVGTHARGILKAAGRSVADGLKPAPVPAAPVEAVEKSVPEPAPEPVIPPAIVEIPQPVIAPEPTTPIQAALPEPTLAVPSAIAAAMAAAAATVVPDAPAFVAPVEAETPAPPPVQAPPVFTAPVVAEAPVAPPAFIAPSVVEEPVIVLNQPITTPQQSAFPEPVFAALELPEEAFEKPAEQAVVSTPQTAPAVVASPPPAPAAFEASVAAPAVAVPEPGIVIPARATVIPEETWRTQTVATNIVPPAPAIEPPVTPPPVAAVLEAPSPFTAGAAPQPVSPPAFVPASVSAPAPVVQPPPLMATIVPEEKPAFIVPETKPEPAAPLAQDVDRVDELLRQFRERYGRAGS